MPEWLQPGALVDAKFYGEWHPGQISRIWQSGAELMVEVRWARQRASSMFAVQDLRPRRGSQFWRDWCWQQLMQHGIHGAPVETLVAECITPSDLFLLPPASEQFPWICHMCVKKFWTDAGGQAGDHVRVAGGPKA